MRKIISQAVSVFKAQGHFKSGSTEVYSDGLGTAMVLHGHTIARYSPAKGLEINLCGWNTKTTRERLNGLPNVSVSTKQGQAYLNGNPIADNGWFSV